MAAGDTCAQLLLHCATLKDACAAVGRPHRVFLARGVPGVAATMGHGNECLAFTRVLSRWHQRCIHHRLLS
jgi:hypothetical protein